MSSLITGTIKKADGTARASVAVQFIPTSTPFILSGAIISSTPFNVTTNGSGVLPSLTLEQGGWKVIIADTDTFFISVPNDGLTHDIADITTSDIEVGGVVNAVQSKDIETLEAMFSDTQIVDVNRSGDKTGIRAVHVFLGNYALGSSAGSIQDAIAACAEAVANSASSLGTSYSLHTVGGNIFTTPTASTDYDTPVDSLYGFAVAANKFYSAIGQEDYDSQVFVSPTDAANMILNYQSHFTLPTNGNSERYYKVTVGEVEFFCVNSDRNEPDGYTNTSVQALWLQAALAASTARWKVVYFGDTGYTSTSGYTRTWMASWPFATWGAHMVIAGGPKNYERLTVDGIPYINAGNSGKTPVSSFTTPISESQFRYTATRTLLLIRSNSYSLQIRAITYSGVVIDSYELIASPREEFFWFARIKQEKDSPTGVTSGLKVTPAGLMLDFGSAPDQVPNMDKAAPSGAGYPYYSDTEPDVVSDPRLRKCVWVNTSVNPIEAKFFNPHTEDWEFGIPEVTQGAPDPGTPLDQLAIPSFSAVSGEKYAFTLVGDIAGCNLYLSKNGAPFTLHDEDEVVYVGCDFPVVYQAYATKTGYRASEVTYKRYYAQ